MKKTACLFACLFAGSVNAVIIDFDSLEVANSALNKIKAGSYSEDGFTFTGSPMYYVGQNRPGPYAGSAGLHLRGSNAVISLVDSASAVFSIESIGLSVLRNGFVSPEVTFTGSILGGGTTTQTFQPLSFGFTDFFFDASFKNLTSLSWNQGTNGRNAHQFDNLRVNITSVPEPTSLALLGLGLAGVGFLRKRKVI